MVDSQVEDIIHKQSLMKNADIENIWTDSAPRCWYAE